jgi:uncharacterized membrane protein
MGMATEVERPIRRASGPTATAHRYARETIEFGRVVNLADAVFAIALTLLVLSLDRVELAGLVSFGMAFFLVANLWWQHHRIVAQLAWLEPGLIAVNLGLLAGVALVPFPTSLVGADWGARHAVLPFIGLFAVLSVLSIAFILRAQRLGAWRRALPDRLFRWVMVDWGANLAVLLGCLTVALWAPLAGLLLLVGASAVHGLTVMRLGPAERRAWF